MCGRYTLIRLADFTDLFPWIRPPDSPPPPRSNIAPSQPVAVVPNTPEPAIDFFRWGLIPSWAKDPSISRRMINARAETLAQKPSFRTSLRRRRCLIPADGFYEWRKEPDGSKTPIHFQLKSRKPFAFAGLWDRWNAPDGSVIPSCTIITTDANDLVREVHDRMPVMLHPEHCRQWLDPADVAPDALLDLLAPYPSDELTARPVARLVNEPG